MEQRGKVGWAYVEGLDLSQVYEEIVAVEGNAGRPATDPRILMALLYALAHNLMRAVALTAR